MPDIRSALEFYRDAWDMKPNKRYGGLEWTPKESLLDDCGEIARTALEKSHADTNTTIRYDGTGEDALRKMADVEVIAALLYQAANPTMRWSYLYPSHNHLHAAVRQRYLEAAARFQDGVAQRKEHSEPDEGRKDAGSTPAADPPQLNAEQSRHAQFMGGVGDEVWD